MRVHRLCPSRMAHEHPCFSSSASRRYHRNVSLCHPGYRRAFKAERETSGSMRMNPHIPKRAATEAVLKLSPGLAYDQADALTHQATVSSHACRAHHFLSMVTQHCATSSANGMVRGGATASNGLARRRKAPKMKFACAVASMIAG